MKKSKLVYGTILISILAACEPVRDRDGKITQSYSYSGINFGIDANDYELDNECDDPRFTGPGAYDYADEATTRLDASDCLIQYKANNITYNGES